MESQLVTLQEVMYTPEYDPETDTYYDMCPVATRERKTRIYICRCKVGTTFGTGCQFKAHIKTKAHQKLIHHYKTYYKDTQEYEDQIKELTRDHELLKMRFAWLDRKYSNVVSQKKTLGEQVSQLREERDLNSNYKKSWGTGDEVFHECGS